MENRDTDNANLSSLVLEVEENMNIYERGALLTGRVADGDFTTPLQLLRAAGLDFTVDTLPLYTKDGQMLAKTRVWDDNGMLTSVAARQNYRALVRRDTGMHFGIVSDRYQPLQNATAAKTVFKATVDGFGAEMTGCGSFIGGLVTYLSGRLPENIELSDGDTLEKTFLIYNDHSGAGAVRVVSGLNSLFCQNQLAAVNRGTVLKISHRGDMALKVRGLADYIRKSQTDFHEFTANAEGMMNVTFSFEDYENYFMSVMNIDPTTLRGQTALNELWALSREDTNTVGGRLDTLWGAMNTVVEFLDHNSTYDPEGVLRLAAVESGMIGYNHKRKVKAWEHALEVGASRGIEVTGGTRI